LREFLLHICSWNREPSALDRNKINRNTTSGKVVIAVEARWGSLAVKLPWRWAVRDVDKYGSPGGCIEEASQAGWTF
jgi:hypothetical protein